MMDTTPIKLRKYSVNIVAMFEEVLQRNTVFVPDDESSVDGKIKLHDCTLDDIEEAVLEQLNELVNEIQEKPLSKIVLDL